MWHFLGVRLREEPAAYGKLGLANLLELREECLREFQFPDAYQAVKRRWGGGGAGRWGGMHWKHLTARQLAWVKGERGGAGSAAGSAGGDRLHGRGGV